MEYTDSKICCLHHNTLQEMDYQSCYTNYKIAPRQIPAKLSTAKVILTTHQTLPIFGTASLGITWEHLKILSKLLHYFSHPSHYPFYIHNFNETSSYSSSILLR